MGPSQNDLQSRKNIRVRTFQGCYLYRMAVLPVLPVKVIPAAPVVIVWVNSEATSRVSGTTHRTVGTGVPLAAQIRDTS